MAPCVSPPASHIGSWYGAVHKVCHTAKGDEPGGLRKLWLSVTVRGGKAYVTSHFQFLHNSQCYVLVDNRSIHNTNLRRQLSPSELWEIRLPDRVSGFILETYPIIWSLVIVQNRVTIIRLLKEVSILFDICLLSFCSEVWHTFRLGVTKIVTV